MNSSTHAIFWFRRDLRPDDLPGLSALFNQNFKPIFTFVFDSTILNSLSPHDRRLSFIYDSVRTLGQFLTQLGFDFHILYGDPSVEIPKLARQLSIQHIFAHQDLEPPSINRDRIISQQVNLHLFQDHHLIPYHFNTQSFKSFSSFYQFAHQFLSTHPPSIYPSLSQLRAQKQPESIFLIPDIESLGFKTQSTIIRGSFFEAKKDLINFLPQANSYSQNRDFFNYPTSNLSTHLRFGTLSVRRAYLSLLDSPTWIQELLWRDFYAHILKHNPKIFNGDAFLAEMNHLPFENNLHYIEAWKNGNTGFPIIDAGIRQLLNTGLMHNRARMLTAQFFSKILNCDWHIGESFFAQHLLDFEWASNNGGWQWCSSTGTDHIPYYRIFNPTIQALKYDPHQFYQNLWNPIPTLPIVNYEERKKNYLYLMKQFKI